MYISYESDPKSYNHQLPKALFDKRIVTAELKAVIDEYEHCDISVL